MRILKMDAAKMRERRNTQANHVAAVPKSVGVDKPARLGSRSQRIGAGNAIATRLKLCESIIKPMLLRGPIGDWRGHSLLDDLLRDDGVVREFHLIDRY